MSCSIIILAAGSSERLGTPKQLLPFNNTTLLRWLVDVAKQSIADKLLVVLGSNAATIQEEIIEADVTIVVNENWKQGMSSSIRTGITEAQSLYPDPDAVLVMTCDQPFVTAELLNELIQTHQTTKAPIVACTYDDTTGPPVLFAKAVLPELLALQGDAGAKQVVKNYGARVMEIPFPEGKTDIDTQEDYDRLK